MSQVKTLKKTSKNPVEKNQSGAVRKTAKENAGLELEITSSVKKIQRAIEDLDNNNSKTRVIKVPTAGKPKAKVTLASKRVAAPKKKKAIIKKKIAAPKRKVAAPSKKKVAAPKKKKAAKKAVKSKKKK